MVTSRTKYSTSENSRDSKHADEQPFCDECYTELHYYAIESE